jgi:hypothetical protein
MDVGDVARVVLIIIFVVVAAVVHVILRRRDHERIRDYLSEVGATDVEISRLVFVGGADAAIYRVVYTDRQGQRRETRCKTREGYADGELDWTDPP